MLVLSGISSWASDASLISAQLIHNSTNFCAEASYSSEDHVLGLSGFARFPNSNWCAGGEIYYTAKERSGGLSAGARYTRHDTHNNMSVLTMVANPMMGHLSTSYTSTIWPKMAMSTSYEFNIYSYDSDVSVGIEYGHAEKEQLIKARFSLAQGLALKLEGRYKSSLVGIGIMTEFGQQPKRSFGVEVQFS
ncbi:Mitochondrial distribution and morphology protein 10 [Blyttiomyces sp. JEL0837]|nr:Mitochondrial distribution and morphology protein 10 [Blyttiomyces sp. JEL0837]